MNKKHRPSSSALPPRLPQNPKPNPLFTLAPALLGLLIYSNTFTASFHLDDVPAITEDPFIHNLFNLPAIWNAFNTRFITGLSLAFNYALGKTDAVGYHCFNIAIHILASYLVYSLTLLILRTPAMFQSSLTKHAKQVALFAGLIFLAHPVQTQAVTYIWQRAASLTAVFYLASLTLYVKSRLDRSKACYMLSLICVILAMFSKEIAITLPLSVAMTEFFFFKEEGESKKQRFLFLLPFFLALFIIPLTLTRVSHITLDLMKPVFFDEAASALNPLDLTRFVSEDRMPRRMYIFTQINVLRTYLRLLILPFNQNLDYDYSFSKNFFEPNTTLSFFLLSAVFLTGAALFKRQKLMAFGIFWFFLTLSVESFVPQIDVIFEHRLYLPMVGFGLFLTAAIHWCSTLINKPKIFAGLLLLVIGIYSALTYQRNFVWKDDLTLWDDAAKKSPNKARPLNNRGVAYQAQGLLDQALQDFNKAIEIDPRYLGALISRGALYTAQGRYKESLEDLNRALEINPQFEKTLTARGVLYAIQGRYDQAFQDFNKAIEIAPNSVDPYTNRAVAYYSLKQYDKSWQDLHQVEKLEGKINPKFLEKLKKDSGREG